MWVMQLGISDDLEVPLTEASIYSRTVFVLWECIYHVYSDLLCPKPVAHHQIMKSGPWKVTVSHWPATVCQDKTRQIGSCTESFQMFKLWFLMKKKKGSINYCTGNNLWSAVKYWKTLVYIPTMLYYTTRSAHIYFAVFFFKGSSIFDLVQDW